MVILVCIITGFIPLSPFCKEKIGRLESEDKIRERERERERYLTVLGW